MEMRNLILCISHPSSQKKRAQRTSSIRYGKINGTGGNSVQRMEYQLGNSSQTQTSAGGRAVFLHVISRNRIF
uniref:Uncharacterized protein n=1 Tax=Picea glauca TaxID=3330 RepID=A0A101M553_PICGL|nr:hypothetical protein ABT39_MTgene915 [Picea glauca]QHR90581.1 hypothetical protein Q903MT_gene4606 [Picea sitchensis]